MLYDLFVRLARDATFDEEACRFDLRHCCEDCAHFDPRSGQCCHEWPNAEHRAASYERPSAEILFCKEFELE